MHRDQNQPQRHHQQQQHQQPKPTQQNPPLQRRHQSFREPSRPQSNHRNNQNNQNNNIQRHASNSNISQSDFRNSTRSLNQTPSECGSNYSKKSNRSRRSYRNRNRRDRRDSSSRTDRTADFTDRSCSPGAQSGRSSQMSQRGDGRRAGGVRSPIRRTNNPFNRVADGLQRADSMSPSAMSRRSSIDPYSSLPLPSESEPYLPHYTIDFVSWILESRANQYIHSLFHPPGLVRGG